METKRAGRYVQDQKNGRIIILRTLKTKGRFIESSMELLQKISETTLARESWIFWLKIFEPCCHLILVLILFTCKVYSLLKFSHFLILRVQSSLVKLLKPLRLCFLTITSRCLDAFQLKRFIECKRKKDVVCFIAAVKFSFNPKEEGANSIHPHCSCSFHSEKKKSLSLIIHSLDSVVVWVPASYHIVN